jgi:hypothetical protein
VRTVTLGAACGAILAGSGAALVSGAGGTAVAIGGAGAGASLTGSALGPGRAIRTAVAAMGDPTAVAMSAAISSVRRRCSRLARRVSRLGRIGGMRSVTGPSSPANS